MSKITNFESKYDNLRKFVLITVNNLLNYKIKFINRELKDKNDEEYWFDYCLEEPSKLSLTS